MIYEKRRLEIRRASPGSPLSVDKELWNIADHDTYVADYFAGCVLMPKPWLRSAYFNGIQEPDDLAELFDVSPRAIAVRLRQLGLDVTPGKRARHPRYRLQHRRFFPARRAPYLFALPVTTQARHRGDRRHE